MDINIDTKELEGLIDKTIEELKKAKGVKVGYIDGQSYPNGLEIRKNALIQEFGNEIIPPRPFIRKAIDTDTDKWKTFFTDNLKKEISVKKIVGLTGQVIKNSLVESIDNMVDPPNAPATIRKKKSSHPLIDTGTMKNSIQTEVLK